MLNIARVLVSAIGITVIAACAAPQRPGQSTTVQFGVVRSAERITLDSAATRGALIGGTLGLAFSDRASSSARNAIGGATLGGITGAASAGNRAGMSYTVDMLDGSSTRIVTDQREIRTGDCVAIERVRGTANIRRKAASFCDSRYAQAVGSVEDSVMSEASKCQDAKRELAEATNDTAADLATRKIELLCNS